MGSKNIVNLADPRENQAQDAATKNYVDTEVAKKSTISGTPVLNQLWFCDDATDKSMATDPTLTRGANELIIGSSESTSSSGQISLYSKTKTFKLTLKAADSMSASTTYTLPSAAPTGSAKFLQCGISNTDLAWAEAPAYSAATNGGLSKNTNNEFKIDFTNTANVVSQLKISKGGTNNDSWINGGIVYYDSTSTKLTNNANITSDGTNLKLKGASSVLNIGFDGQGSSINFHDGKLTLTHSSGNSIDKLTLGGDATTVQLDIG